MSLSSQMSVYVVAEWDSFNECFLQLKLCGEKMDDIKSLNDGDTTHDKTRCNLFAARFMFVLMLAPDVTGPDEDYLYQLKYIPY